MTLLEIEIKNILTEDTNLPRSYGLYKIHKDGFALRFIISCVNTRLTFISDFYKEIQGINAPNKYGLASFDIENIFNNIPTNRVIKSIKKRIMLARIYYVRNH